MDNNITENIVGNITDSSIGGILQNIDAGKLDEFFEENYPINESVKIDDAEMKMSDEDLDRLWQARTGLDFDSLSGAIETLIFMSEKPISIQNIRKLIDEDIPLRVLHNAIEALQIEYETKRHGIRLLEVAEGYQFRTKAIYSKFVQDLYKVNSLVLSPTALEVLAIVAYKQPVSRMDIDKIRGVDSSHILRTLMDKRLVRSVGRSEDLGRPVVYGTTLEFLEVFNLADISELPPEHELMDMVQNEVGKIADIKGIVGSGDKARFYFDEIDELDKLSSSIKDVNADTPFLRSLKLENEKRVNADGSKAKSAFEILEEFVEVKRVVAQNKQAIDSSLLVPGADPRVVHDVELAGEAFLNAPDTSASDDFEMIDLETGLPLANLFSEEESSIANELDLAFDKIITNNDQLNSVDNSIEELKELGELNNNIDQLEQKIAENASDYGLDLNFLNIKDKDNDKNVEVENEEDDHECYDHHDEIEDPSDSIIAKFKKGNLDQEIFQNPQ